MFLAVRVIIVLIFASFGYVIGSKHSEPLLGVAGGFALALLSIVFEYIIKKIQIGSILGGIIGLFLGVFSAFLITYPLKGVAPEGFGLVLFIIGALFGYGGLLAGLKKGQKLTVADIVRTIKGQAAEENLKLLDTSVIIDGRIADVCESGFLEGGFVVPQFILQELQYIADSPDSLKRARGRRGLDILHRMQKMAHITVRIIEEDFPKIKEVDSKLVALAKAMNAKIITNDFNLNKVAELQGVMVLNINELANAIKPVVLPGETFKAFVIKEGKEHNQGVAYLDDGTMVVVDNGRRVIGKNVEVTVTSVLQTTAGRMIFAKLKEDYERE